jgi:hypothetical protein
MDKISPKNISLQPKAEEETGSAEEQPASNRLLRYTESVLDGAVHEWSRLFIFRKRCMAKKTYSICIARGGSQGFLQHRRCGPSC